MTDGERFGDERVRLGPIQWAVVTKYLVPSGLFVRLEDSGEKAFMDMALHPAIHSRLKQTSSFKTKRSFKGSSHQGALFGIFR